jgi:glycosyltransferase involved in cell wall biosynthesis
LKDDLRFRVLIIGAQCDGTDVGEAWCGFEWISRIALACDVTLLTLRFPGHLAPSMQLPQVEVVEWDAFPYFSQWPRLNGTMKPWYPSFYIQARRWLKQELKNGGRFDIIHHLTPMAMRYPSPCIGRGFPFIIGPVAGSLPTPSRFRDELGTQPLFAKLRNFDRFRLNYDPLIRRTYEEAGAVICSGRYVYQSLAHLNLKRVEFDTEVGINQLAPRRPKDSRAKGSLRLLYVGRVVRTKGLRDAIRALAALPDLPDVILNVAGTGEDLDACKDETRALGLANRVCFLGRLPREQIETLYSQADVFLFPSFREPTGIVLFEAMRHGLPVITANAGGPGHIIDNSCGIRVDVHEPRQFATDLAHAIRVLATNPTQLTAYEEGARKRVRDIGLWSHKIEKLLELYADVARLSPRTCRILDETNG